MNNNPLRRIVVGGLRGLRSTWLVVGATLLLLVLIEVGFRIHQVSTTSFARPYPIPEAYAKADWFREYNVEYDKSITQRWKPLLYFGRTPSFQGKYINVDAEGHRVTPQPTSPAIPKASVYFFGGSTLWGDSQRDSFTIAAVTARRLQELAGPGDRIEVKNFGESGYVSTQGVLGLEIELRAGKRPAVVVFYDGINDVVSTVQMGVGGIPQNEMKRASEFELGRRLDRPSYLHTPASDLKTVAILSMASLRQLLSVNWVLQRIKAPTPPMISVDSAARAAVTMYAANARLVEALGKEYGFTPIFIWQTTLQATPKPLTPFEERRVALIKSDPPQNRILEVHRVVPPMLDSVMAIAAPGHFINQVAVFAGDTTNVFSDHIGHNTEQSIPKIVDGFWPQLKDAVSKRMMN